MCLLGDVFVSAGTPTITYVEREELNLKIKSAKINPSKHIFIYGNSKSGKTTLWKKTFDDSEYIKIPINTYTTISDIYTEILTRLEAYYTNKKQQSKGTETKIFAEISAKIFALLKGKVHTEYSGQHNSLSENELIVKPILTANTVIKFLALSNKRIIIEDFHYANDDLIKIFSQDLKAFSDEKCQFIIVSVPSKTSDILSQNNELTGRISEIPVDFFTSENLESIIDKGTTALNVDFPKLLKKEIIKESLGLPSLTQDICQKICLLNNIDKKKKTTLALNDNYTIDKACKTIAEEQKSTYTAIVNIFGVHKHGNDKSNVNKWILRVIQKEKISESGMTNTEIFRKIKEYGNSSLNQGSVTFALNNMEKKLVSNGLPIVLEVRNKTLFIKDRYMTFVFTWLPELIENLV